MKGPISLRFNDLMRSAVHATLLLLALLPGTARSQEQEGRIPGPMVVYSDKVMFTVKEPKGWVGDIQNAKHIEAAVVLYRENEAQSADATLIAVQVASKVDENTRADLAHDMEGFRERYPAVQFGDLAVKHPTYKAFSKIFSIPETRFEYVTFLNPGKKVPYLFTVIMNTGKRKADKNELSAYREIVRSIEYISQEGVKPPEGLKPR
jgi:hypothetical protein